MSLEAIPAIDLKPELQEVFKKHHVNAFELFHIDQFTYRLKTNHVTQPVELIQDITNVLGRYSKIYWSVLDLKLPPLVSTKTAEASNVNHPKHYNSGSIEVIEAIEDWELGFHLGNAVKYNARAGKKDPTKEIEDLEKAIWYIRRKIELIKAKAEKRAVVRPNDMNPRTGA